jgi:hypothetical protein
MNAPMVEPLTKPSSHRANRITAMLYSMAFLHALALGTGTALSMTGAMDEPSVLSRVPLPSDGAAVQQRALPHWKRQRVSRTFPHRAEKIPLGGGDARDY